MKVCMELRPGTPQRLRRALQASGIVEVTEGDEDRVGVSGARRRLTILGRPQVTADLAEAVQGLARTVPRGTVGLVVAGTIPARERITIEDHGLSWADGRGALHLEWSGVLLHVDNAGRRPAAAHGGRGDGPGLGPAAIRALQILLADAEGDWTLNRLAIEAGISVGQAHNVFRALERDRLVETGGKGPRQRRRVTDRHAALDWLAALDRTRRRPAAAAAYLYARTQDELFARFAQRADDTGVPYAVTGAAGAYLLGVPVVTSLVVTQIRVGVLDAAALDALGVERLDAEAAGLGMNLELWTDTGELGTFRPATVDGIRIAPPIRVWLDLARQGGRNADAATLFREQAIERA